MPERTDYPNGVPCWVDLSTTDTEAAKQFYSGLFGWEVGEAGPPETNGYTQFLLRDKPVAAVSAQMEAQREMGVPPTWNSYVAVDDADQTAAKVAPAGGTLMMEPFDVMGFGRMALMQDPTGAVISIWQAGTHFGAAIVNEPVSLSWNELATRDPEKAAAFYSQVLGWEARKNDDGPMTYYEWHNDGALVGGMFEMTDDRFPPEVPSHWGVYFAVEDADATAAKATELGGAMHVPPMDIPAGRFAVLADPQGASFMAIKLSSGLDSQQ